MLGCAAILLADSCAPRTAPGRSEVLDRPDFARPGDIARITLRAPRARPHKRNPLSRNPRCTLSSGSFLDVGSPAIRHQSESGPLYTSRPGHIVRNVQGPSSPARDRDACTVRACGAIVHRPAIASETYRGHVGPACWRSSVLRVRARSAWMRWPSQATPTVTTFPATQAGWSPGEPAFTSLCAPEE